MGEFRLPQGRFTRIRPEPWYENFGSGGEYAMWLDSWDHGIPMGRACWVVQSSDAGKILDYLSGQIGPEQLTRDLTQTISGMGATSIRSLRSWIRKRGAP